MPLIPWRKFVAGIKGQGTVKEALTATQHITQTTTLSSVQLASAAETSHGYWASKVITPRGLSASVFGDKVVYLKVIAEGTTLTTGDGKMYFTVPDTLNGMDLKDADAAVYTVSSSGLPTIQVHNATDASDMLSTRITIDVSEKTSYTAATAPVIDTAEDDVVTGDIIRIDVDVAGTGTAGLDVILTFGVL